MINFLQERLDNVHGLYIYLSDSLVPDEIIELSIKSSKTFQLTQHNSQFYELLDLIIESYDNLVKYYEKDYHFFRPILIIQPDNNIIIIKMAMKEKVKDSEEEL